MSGRILNSHFEIQPLPSREHAIKDLIDSFSRVMKVIDENPSTHLFFDDAELNSARRSIENYKKVQQMDKA